LIILHFYTIITDMQSISKEDTEIMGITDKGNGCKGESLLKSIKNFVALDVETTGLSSHTDKIIEIGLVRVRDGVEKECFSSLIQPGKRISSYITALTGITNAMLADAPVMDEILSGALDFIGNDIIVGHNVNFDLGFMLAACMDVMQTGFGNDFIDTMRFSRKHFKELPNHKLATLVCAFCIDQRDAHRALADALATARCYLHMCEQIAKNKKVAV